MKIEMTCPHCHTRHDGATQVTGDGDPAVRPTPGTLIVCFSCGALARVTEQGALEPCEMPTDADDKSRATITYAQALIRERGFARACEKLDALVGLFLASGRAPRFRFPPREIALIGPLEELGARFALNDDARALVAAACTPPGDRLGPTVTMLRIVLERRGVAVEAVSLSELGLSPTGAPS